ARHAGEMISELTLAIAGGIGLGTIARVIHPYPTQAEAIRKIADSYNRTRLTSRMQWLLGKCLAWLSPAYYSDSSGLDRFLACHSSVGPAFQPVKTTAWKGCPTIRDARGN